MVDLPANVPPHVAAAAKVVDDWLKGQPNVAGNPQPQPRPERANDKFARTVRSDTPPAMPAWSDPRR
jgi:hypothetical protein